MVCITLERKKVVLDFDVVRIIVDFFKFERRVMVNCCIRVVVEFIKGCSKEMV